MDSIDDVGNSICRYIPLYFAQSMNELMEKSEYKCVNIASIKKCIEMMRKLQIELMKAKTSKDQELQFLYLYRYASLVARIPVFKDYSKEKEKYKKDLMIAKENIKLFEQLKASLEIRYKNKYKCASGDNNSKSSKTASSPKEPLEENRSEINNSNIQGKINSTNIDCLSLYYLIKRKVSLMVLDTRPNGDFRESHVFCPHIINIPNDVIKKGDSASMIGKKLLFDEDRMLWKKRNIFENIVILDWYSKESTLTSNSAVSILREAMVEWDPGTEYKNLPLLLEGGFEEFFNRYPHMTTNPHPTPPTTNDSSVNILESFDYPMIDLEVVKENVVPSTTPEIQPTVRSKLIDRSSKPTKKVESIMEVEPNTNSHVEETMKLLPDPPSNQSVEEPKKSPDADLPLIVPPSTVIKPQTKVSSHPKELNSAEVPLPHSETNQKMLEILRKVKPEILPQASLPKTPTKNDPNNESIYITSLKGDGKSPNSNLKRSSSSPNINQLKDDDIPMKLPSFTRSNKPRPHLTYGEKTDATYGSTALGLTGLKNFANNCYMNSILQCLSNTEALVKELINLNKPALNSQSKTKGMVALEVIQTLRSMWSGDIKVYSIKDLKALMGSMKDIFKGASHQDSNEFLIILLEYLHEDLNVHDSLTALVGADESTGEKAWGEFRRKNTSVIQRLFYGQQKSTVTCSTCQHASVTFEPFFNLFVPLPPSSDKATLQDCIQLYMSGESISGWKCPKCQGERNATKKFDISKLPPVLIIALKRFTQENDSWLHKKENVVMYPIQDLDMRRFTVRDSEQRYTNYDLYAVSTHSGTLKSGHYKAICKNYLTKKWYMFDDQFIDPLPLNSVRNHPDAYILFYNAVNN